MTVSKRALDALLQHRAKAPLRDMRQAFEGDPLRFKRFSLRLDDLLLDWSKCAVTAETMKLLHALAQESGVTGLRDRMFEGEPINITEGRAVLHIALRNRTNRPIRVDGQDVMPDVNRVLSQMRDFSTGVRSGAIATASGKRISDVVNIGIGGSDLGPAMTTLALSPYHDGPRLHFVSNIDGAHLADTLKLLDPARTLFLIASKTFTTVETMTNAHSAREWIVKHLGETAVPKHFAAISTALDKVKAFGIGEERTFGFWDWVGGRYSVWSAIGLPLMIAVGSENFGHFLDGAHAVDEHFRSAPPEQNLPLTLGLLGAWHRNICAYATRAIIPYDQRLSRLPAYLQQLDMESNGKGVERDGRPAETETGPIVWGEPGTNGQHAFFQLIHQGTSTIPVEFLIAAQSHEPALAHHHDLLMANCLAQSEALMRGRTYAEAKKQLLDQGKDEAEAERLAPHRVFTGNRPSITIAYRKLDPRTLGRLIALYEHRVFTEAAIWNINAFDQWGVELGKELATGLVPIVEGKSEAENRDSSTQGLVAHLRGLH
ncbi:MAG: glucose-6-phosphate isomerase [Parvibaculaceae bacterium]